MGMDLCKVWGEVLVGSRGRYVLLLLENFLQGKRFLTLNHLHLSTGDNDYGLGHSGSILQHHTTGQLEL